MKVVLTGMFNRQLAEVADELRAEFPEVDVEVIGNDEGRKRIVNAARDASLVVCGRFVSHVVWKELRESTRTIMVFSGARSMADKARQVLRGEG
jgi:hypothetical protein